MHSYTNKHTCTYSLTHTHCKQALVRALERSYLNQVSKINREIEQLGARQETDTRETARTLAPAPRPATASGVFSRLPDVPTYPRSYLAHSPAAHSHAHAHTHARTHAHTHTHTTSEASSALGYGAPVPSRVHATASGAASLMCPVPASDSLLRSRLPPRSTSAMTLRGGSGEGSGVENGSVGWGGAIAEAADQELEMLRTSRHSADNARGAGAGALGGLRLGSRAASAGAAMMEQGGSRRFGHVRDMVLSLGQEEQQALALALIQQKGQRRVRDTRPATALGLPSTPSAPSMSQPHDSAQEKWQEGGAEKLIVCMRECGTR